MVMESQRMACVADKLTRHVGSVNEHPLHFLPPSIEESALVTFRGIELAQLL